MNDPAECDHDFRRLEASDINPEYDDRLVAVVCAGCGKSPVYFTTTGVPMGKPFVVNGQWPDSHRVIDWGWDDTTGPSVEFEIVSDPDGG